MKKKKLEEIKEPNPPLNKREPQVLSRPPRPPTPVYIPGAPNPAYPTPPGAVKRGLSGSVDCKNHGIPAGGSCYTPLKARDSEVAGKPGEPEGWPYIRPPTRPSPPPEVV
ncbi:hypothetical protein M501DRAFT_1002578 [Patellaria atrata CBS 101060]|uniref:Uncharacterized protein n=1 Tax=Patellaria atrata CBS 101060 TaxID=1346257 RepID=A0A9P4SCQ7_9PEZI|nr:hypothetical protein M501DRAFT_1002578 [Patellaria atrata CBS 101060]